MNNIKIARFLFLIIGISIAIISCQEDIVDEFTPLEERWTSLDDFFSSADKVKRVLIPHAEDEFVVETNNLYFHFLENSLKDEFNQPISGEAIFEIKEIKRKGDFILNQVDSETYDGDSMFPIVVFNLRITKDGKEVNLKDQIFIYKESETDMIDLEVTSEWIVDNDKDGWFPTVTFDASIYDWNFYAASEKYQGSGYKMYLKKLGWFQMGSYATQVYPSGDVFGTLEVELADEFSTSDSKVLLAYKDRLCVIPGKRNANMFKFEQVLKAEEVEVIVIAVKDDMLYYGKKHFITEQDNKISISAEKSDYVSVLAQLNNL